MHILGVNLPDRRLIKIALTSFYGISHSTSRLICARMGFHDRLTVSELSEPQINELSAFLSSPSSYMGSHGASSSSTSSSSNMTAERQLAELVIESDLRRQTRANIQHHRTVGSYRGRRHAMHLPVRGQRTKTNAKTARKLNRIDRRAFSTSTRSTSPQTTSSAFRTSSGAPQTSLLQSLRWKFRLASLQSA